MVMASDLSIAWNKTSCVPSRTSALGGEAVSFPTVHRNISNTKDAYNDNECEIRHEFKA